MATADTAEYTAQNSTARDANPSMRPLQLELKVARYGVITIEADLSDDAGDDIRLGSLGCNGVIFPEHCRLVGLSGSGTGSFTLEKVEADGTVTALTGVATLGGTDGTSVPFARKTGAYTGGAFLSTDTLQLTVTTDGAGTAVVAGDTLELTLAYTAEHCK
jgi:hypothetical protein